MASILHFFLSLSFPLLILFYTLTFIQSFSLFFFCVSQQNSTQFVLRIANSQQRICSKRQESVHYSLNQMPVLSVINKSNTETRNKPKNSWKNQSWKKISKIFILLLKYWLYFVYQNFDLFKQTFILLYLIWDVQDLRLSSSNNSEINANTHYLCIARFLPWLIAFFKLACLIIAW